MIKTEIYDAAKGVKIYTLCNNKGMTAQFIERGATIISLNVPDKNGNIENVVLGLKDYNEWATNTCYINVVPGRFANRIGDSKFTLDGVEYKLNPNDGKNSLHGGPKGFSTQDWTVKEITDGDEPTITFEYVSADGEENFPGTLVSSVTYKVTNENGLEIHYQATTDKATPVNLTQHAYFNLSGNYKNQSIAGYAVKINADAITEVDSESIPTGKLAPVEGTDFDFREFRTLSSIKDFYYDHNFCLNTNNDGAMMLAGAVKDPESGRLMKVFTDLPGMQFYTGNFLDGTISTNNGKKVTRQSAFCFETQLFPDAPNKKNFESCILRPWKKYSTKTLFKFEVEA